MIPKNKKSKNRQKDCATNGVSEIFIITCSPKSNTLNRLSYIDTRIYCSYGIFNDLSILLSEKQFRNIEKYLFIFHDIYRFSVFRDKNKSRNQWIQIYSQHLKRVMGRNYKVILNFLVENGFILIKENYRPQSKYKKPLMKRFKIAPKYQDCDFHLRKTYRLNLLSAENISTENHEFLVKQMDYLGFDRNDLAKIDFCIESYGKSDHAKKCARKMIEAINQKYYMIHVDKKSGRFFSVFVNLPKYLREFLRYKGQKLQEIDIRNSQILLLYNAYEGMDCEESRKFLRIAQDFDFYEYVLQTKLPNKERDEIKICLFKFLFGWTIRPETVEISELFKNEFPILLSQIKKIKQDNHRQIAYNLQRAEADAIIGNVVTFARLNDIFVLTIHDSFMLLAESAEKIKNETVRVFQEMYGLTPTLRNMEEKILEKAQIKTKIREFLNPSKIIYKPLEKFELKPIEFKQPSECELAEMKNWMAEMKIIRKQHELMIGP